MSFEDVVYHLGDPKIEPKQTKILYKFATRGRPEKFKKVLETYYQMMLGKNPFEFIVSVDKDDTTMNNPAMISYLQSKPNLKFFFGESKTKIDAINTDMKDIDFDILVVVSDDMIPQVQGFDDIIVNDMLKHFPNMDGALHYNDGCCGQDRTITLSILGKKLYEQFGYIYHPSYKSFFCDNEFTDVVRKLNKVVYISQIIIKHVWEGRQNGDETYKRNSKLGKEDERNYNFRRVYGFPKDNIQRTKWIVVAYYTESTIYEKYVKKLRDSLEKFNVPYEIVPIQDLGSWDKNTQHKPTFLKNMLKKYFSNSIIYVDIDAEFLSYPILFDKLDSNLEVNIAVHTLNRKGRTPELLSGTIYLKNTCETGRILDEWELLCKSNPAIWDQKLLAETLKKHKGHLLPEQYCTIFDLMADVKNPVIVHFAASREIRKLNRERMKCQKVVQRRIVDAGGVVKIRRVHN